MPPKKNPSSRTLRVHYGARLKLSSARLTSTSLSTSRRLSEFSRAFASPKWLRPRRRGTSSSLAVRIISIIVVAVMAFLAGKNLKAGVAKEIIKYSIGWAVIVVVLDLILTVPFTGWEIYTKPDMYIGYALIVLIPLLAIKKSEQIQQ